MPSRPAKFFCDLVGLLNDLGEGGGSVLTASGLGPCGGFWETVQGWKCLWALFGPWGRRPVFSHTRSKKTQEPLHGQKKPFPTCKVFFFDLGEGGGSVLTASGLGFDLAGAFRRPCRGWKCPCSPPRPLVLGSVLTLSWALSGPCGARSWALFWALGPTTCLQPSAPHTVKKKPHTALGPTTCLQPSAPHSVKKTLTRSKKKTAQTASQNATPHRHNRKMFLLHFCQLNAL